MGGAAGGAGIGSAVGGPPGAAICGGMGYLGAEAAVQTNENVHLQQEIEKYQNLKQYYEPMSALHKAWLWFKLTIAIGTVLFIISMVYHFKHRKTAHEWYAKIDKITGKDNDKDYEEYKRQRGDLQSSTNKLEE